jgi:spore coat protein U-like protein
VIQSCAIAAQGSLNFGQFRPITVNNSVGGIAVKVQSANVALQCTNGVTGVWVGLLSGNKPSSFDGSGILKNGTYNLNYYLYYDSGYSKLWASSSAVNSPSIVSDGTVHSYAVYATIPNNQNTIPLGSYSDTITATVHF